MGNNVLQFTAQLVFQSYFVKSRQILNMIRLELQNKTIFLNNGAKYWSKYDWTSKLHLKI